MVDLSRSTLSRPLALQLPEDDQLRNLEVNADPARLRQVLLDLIENADKYSPPQGPIQLA